MLIQLLVGIIFLNYGYKLMVFCHGAFSNNVFVKIRTGEKAKRVLVKVNLLQILLNLSKDCCNYDIMQRSTDITFHILLVSSHK
jgi:hypothetical protein